MDDDSSAGSPPGAELARFACRQRIVHAGGTFIASLPALAMSLAIGRILWAQWGPATVVILIVLRTLWWAFWRSVYWNQPDENTIRATIGNQPGRVRQWTGLTGPRERVYEAWHEVARAAGAPDSRCRFQLKESALYSAAAVQPQGLIIVTHRGADFTQRSLQAVLAHAYGHVITYNFAVEMLTSLWVWPVNILFCLPAEFVLALFGKHRRLVLPAVLSLACVAAVAAVLSTLDPATARVLAAAVVVACAASIRLSWQAEYAADRVAVELGYGNELIDHLRHELTGYERIGHPQPPVGLRVKRIEHTMDRLPALYPPDE